MGYIKSRANGTVQGMYCDICGKEYVRVISNPNNPSQDMCVKCYNDFYSGGQQKDQQIAELKSENKQLQQQLKDNTKQVCEKIREEIKQLEQNIDNNPCFLNKEYKLELKRKSIYKNIFKILDQIEKGE